MTNPSLSEVNSSVNIPTGKGWFKRLLAFAGPAYLVSVGYMDPGNWATDLAGGSQFGYKLIFVLLMSNLMALLLQSLSARLGLVAGLDLAQASRLTYKPAVNIPLYIFAEIAIAACDLAEVIGMAIGLHLLFDLPILWGILITVLDTFLLLFLLNRGIRKMEAFILSLIAIIMVAFFIEMLIVKPVASEIAKGFIPTALGGKALYIAIGIIGATVMPHNLYLHSSLVQTRKIERNKKGILQALKYNFFDSLIALNLAFLVNSAILILAAAAFFTNGLNQVAEIEDAHLLLRNIFGDLAPACFAIALIAAGQSSTVTGTLAGQIIMEGYLNLRIRPWLRRLLTRLLAIIPAVLVVIFLGEERLTDMLILSQVILSIQLGFAVIPLIHFNSNEKLMGHFVIKPWVKILAWISALIIVGLNVKLVYETLVEWLSGNTNWWLSYLVIPPVLFAASILVYISILPFLQKTLQRHVKVPHGTYKKLKAVTEVAYHRVGISIDFSAIDTTVINNAIAQGGKRATYSLIHIVESVGARILGDDAMDHETQSDIEQLQKYADELQELGYSASIAIGYGNPAEKIAELVASEKCDILIMGAHGHRGWKDIILGSTLDKVRHLVKVPVLIVKP